MQRYIPHPVQPPASPPGHGGHQACAVCKHQRKKCTGRCELASFFPVSKTREFELVHKVFGVSNLTKMLKAVDSMPERERAAETLTWEAEWREINPSEGCYSEVMQLKNENAILRSIIGSCDNCSHLALPPPYHAPVRPPERHPPNGNNGGGNLIHHNHEGIHVNNANVGGGMGFAAMIPQQMINHLPVNRGNLIDVYDNPRPAMYVPENGGRRNIGHGELYLPNHGEFYLPNHIR